MKLQNILPAVLFAAVLAPSCTNDDDVQRLTKTDIPVTFSAYAPKAPLTSRAILTSSNLTDFITYGVVDKKLLMNEVKVSKKNSKWTYSPLQYYPREKNVNFYSFAPAGITYDKATNASDASTVNNFKNDGTVDLLYGVNLDRNEGNSKVNVYFRHALSQIRFRFLRNAEQNVNATVYTVDLLGTNTTATFAAPQETTTATNKAYGVWSGHKDIKDVNIYHNAGFATTDFARELNNTGILFGIPQDLAMVIDENPAEGAIIRIRARITNKFNGKLLWPDESAPGYDKATGTAYIYYPLWSRDHTKWVSGCVYRYTFNVGIPDAAGFCNDVTVAEYPDFSDLTMGDE